MFNVQTVEIINQMATDYQLDPVGVCAVAHVESSGIISSNVNGRDEPLIRFEGHYFDRRLDKKQQEVARLAKLASPKAGAIANPAKQTQRWQLLHRACAINKTAAYESTSWGIGQVMGAHWYWLGFSNVEDLVQTARTNVSGQIDLMVRFIVYSNLSAALNARNWPEFSHHYNGPLYAQNAYDRKLAAAVRLYTPLLQSV